MPGGGWKQLLEDWPWFRGEDAYPVLPNSEFMPPVRLFRKPYGCWDPVAFTDDDPWGWPVDEYEEGLSLRPGLSSIAGQLLSGIVALFRGRKAGGGAYKLRDNPYWPADLASASRTIDHERFVLLLPLALSLAQDDKARVRWTLFGASEQGPARAFWKGFFSAPGQELPARQALAFFQRLLAQAYGEPEGRLEDLRQAGFRILPHARPGGPFGDEGPLPSWTAAYLLEEGDPLCDVKYLLTFRPFADLPRKICRQYRAGELHLLPFPGSLLFWGVPSYWRLQKQLPFATQIPLLHFLERHSGIHGVRVPQSGWFHEDGPATRGGAGGRDGHRRGPLRESYKRTHRAARVQRYEDDLVTARAHRLARVLFSTRPKHIGLYNKPMARNVQLWTDDFQLLLDGPNADTSALERAAAAVAEGGLFGYRMQVPALRVGRHEVYWHRPLAAFRERSTGRARVVPQAPLGYLTAYSEDPGQPLELWPRLLDREAHGVNLELFKGRKENPPHRTVMNVRKILHGWDLTGRTPMPRPFARQLLTLEKKHTLVGWLRSLVTTAPDPVKGRWLAEQVRQCLEPAGAAGARRLPRPLTFGHTTRRSFEVEYWETIAALSSGAFVNKNNADCILDVPTRQELTHSWRDLEGLGGALLAHYTRLIKATGTQGRVLAGELPFHWRTQYAFPWMGGWLDNQRGKTYERNLLVIIPGRDRERAVIMADHYDTAYMSDHYYKASGGTGARLAAPGADDNCSATAALMLGAPAFIELGRQGQLGCDVWLLHLTGEEYPAEGQGACNLCRRLVEGALAMHATDGTWHDLSGVRIQGLYVLDMIAHNNARGRDIFQIAPGAAPESFWLAYQAHLANEIWNEATAAWNRRPARRKAGRGAGTPDGKTVPPLCQHPRLSGEIRPDFDLRSTLYNTDGQAFSDTGVPVVLLMENYDIDRKGYHDSLDTLEKINLDYGAALAAITIEGVARAATEQAPPAWARRIDL